jgi:hypothetical protein
MDCITFGYIPNLISSWFLVQFRLHRVFTMQVLLMRCAHLSLIQVSLLIQLHDNWIINYLLFPLALQPSAGYGLLVSRSFVITHNDAPVGFFFFRILLLKLTINRSYSNPRPQQASGRRPTP